MANYGGDPIPGSWKVYNIPLVDLHADGKQISGFDIQNALDPNKSGQQLLYVDEIRFQTQPTPGKSIIYSDYLNAGWFNNSYQSSINLINTNPVYSGTNSLAWSAMHPWSSLYLEQLTPFDTSGYTMLHFAAQSANPNQHYVVELLGKNQQRIGIVWLSNYGGDPNVGNWKVYNIPLKDLNATNKLVGGFELQSAVGNNQLLYLDEIQFAQ